MNNNEPFMDHPDARQLLDLRFTPASFTLLGKAAHPENLTPVMQIYTDQLLDLGFIYSHEILVDQCIGKSPQYSARLLAYLNVSQNAYAILTDLYHEKSWVYFTHYFARDHRVITTCQPGALQLEPIRELSSSAGFTLENTGSGTLATQWKKHKHAIASKFPTEKALLMDPHQHLVAEQEAYDRYTDLLLDCVILRQSDTQLTGFTHTGAGSYHAAVTSKSAKRPKPKTDTLIRGRSKTASMGNHKNFRNAALAASVAVFGVLVYGITSYDNKANTLSTTTSVSQADFNDADVNEIGTTQVPVIEGEQQEDPELIAAIASDSDLKIFPTTLPELPPVTTPDDTLIDNNPNASPEQFIVASEQDEMWRIAVENAEFYLLSNDGDPAPWIRTARKMAAGFKGQDPRLARTYFLAAMLEENPAVAEQQYNRALSIQTKSIGLYHAETAQTLEALAWVAEDARDALEDAITHQRLALNIYRSVFGEEAEDTRAARWKLQYFEDRLAGRRPKSDEARRLLPALARFAR